VFGVGDQVADIAEFDARGQGDAACLQQRVRRRGRDVLEHVSGGEAGKMQWHAVSHFAAQPAAHVLDLFPAVVEARDEQHHDLEPDLFPAQGQQRVQDRLQGAAALLLVEFFREGLEVDLDRSQQAAKFKQRLFLDVAVADHDVGNAVFLAQGGAIAHIFVKYHRFAVGVGDERAILEAGLADHFFGEHPDRLHLLGPALGDLPVLAEAAAEVAAGRGQ